MKRYLFFSVLLLVAMLNHAQEIRFTQVVKGIVLDEQSNHPIAGVTVIQEGVNKPPGTVTDSTGFFRLQKIPVGRQTIRFSAIGYEDAVLRNIEVTSSHEVVLELKLKENFKRLDNVILQGGKSKVRALNEAAMVSARQLSMDEAFRYSGTRSDPSRMAQNFAGVSGANDARNDIVIRGNSPAGVLWRMDGIDIPNPNHFSTLGATGGPVSILNINTLKNSDFMTGAFPAQYGNALSGVFDLRLRNGNTDKYEFLGQMGFNGFEFGAEGPLDKKTHSSFLANYRYSMVAALQAIGLSVGTGSATPYYQDGTFKLNMPTKKAGTFSLFGLGGESHIRFSPESQDKDNLYSSPDGSIRDRYYRSLTGVIGLSNTYFFNQNTSGKTILSVSRFGIRGEEDIIENNKPRRDAFDLKDRQTRYALGYTFNKKMNSRDQFTTGVVTELNKLSLQQDQIRDGDSTETRVVDTRKSAMSIKAFINYGHRFSGKLSSNFGLHYQLFTLNNTASIEPRWNIRYQLKPNQALSFGAGLHSQAQPLEVYFYRSLNSAGQTELTNLQLGFVKSIHAVAGYDITISRHLRLKAECYGQYIYHAAVEKTATSFSMLNAGADFGFPDKTNLVNKGRGYNYGIEITLERFLHNGFYYLVTASLFESKYKGSDGVLRNTAFNSNYVTNMLGGKEFRINAKTSFSIDSKLAVAGGQRYTPFDIPASTSKGYVVYKEKEAYSLQNAQYLRWDLKFSYIRNLKKITQKWYVDLQNLSNHKNVYMRTLNPKTGTVSAIDQIGFFPNINYQITF